MAVTIQCDLCGCSYREGRTPQEDFEIQEFHKIDFVGGYGSVFGDGTRVKLDICQTCLRGLIGNFIPETTDPEYEQ